MRCLTDEQIDQLLRDPNGGGAGRHLAHIHRCVSCRRRLDAARADVELIEQIRELQRSRSMVGPG